jgi:hypothetical protein
LNGEIEKRKRKRERKKGKKRRPEGRSSLGERSEPFFRSEAHDYFLVYTGGMEV